MNRHRDGGPASPVQVECDRNGDIQGIQTMHCGGWETGLSIRELAAIEFTKAHLMDLMPAKTDASTTDRIKEAISRGWRTADGWIEAREFYMEIPPPPRRVRSDA